MTRDSLDANRAEVPSLAFVSHPSRPSSLFTNVESLANTVDCRVLMGRGGNVPSPLDSKLQANESGNNKLQGTVTARVPRSQTVACIKRRYMLILRVRSDLSLWCCCVRCFKEPYDRHSTADEVRHMSDPLLSSDLLLSIASSPA